MLGVPVMLVECIRLWARVPLKSTPRRVPFSLSLSLSSRRFAAWEGVVIPLLGVVKVRVDEGVKEGWRGLSMAPGTTREKEVEGTW